MNSLSLYVHIPWCVKKCPYCDFNSHQLRTDAAPEREYVERLIQDLEQDLPTVWGRSIHSIFIGGGTPSLFSPDSLALLLREIRARIIVQPDAEITMEANPGTLEYGSFKGYIEAGINRLSVGIQSFQDDKLKTLGRIHSSTEAIKAVKAAQNAGFDNINLDLMFGLPNQSHKDALYDLETAISLNPTHISWYQLTLEPNTLFYKQPPTLPKDDNIWEMQQLGQTLLAEAGYQQYETSAYAKDNRRCQHNLNYWRFGDYLGIGAGAHAKITDFGRQTVTRSWKNKHPKAYLDANQALIAGSKIIQSNELVFEFMMNALRLFQKIDIALFCESTWQEFNTIEPILAELKQLELMEYDQNAFWTTPKGKDFLNDILERFLLTENN